MFGIGGGEMVFILFIALMLFGSDKIPDIARTLGKTVAQIKNATNDIKSEISKGMEDHGFDKSITDITGNINAEINKARENLIGDAPEQIAKAKDDLEDLAGPVKRQS